VYTSFISKAKLISKDGWLKNKCAIKRRARDQFFASKIGLENCNSKIVIVFRIPLYCSITSFCEWLRMLGWRGFTNPRPKIAKFKKLRSSFCVLKSRITDYKKHFTIFLDFHGSKGRPTHWWIKLIALHFKCQLLWQLQLPVDTCVSIHPIFWRLLQVLILLSSPLNAFLRHTPPHTRC